jgi:hypothetical protein
LSPLEEEWIGDDMVGPSSRREGSSAKEKWEMPWAMSTLGI